MEWSDVETELLQYVFPPKLKIPHNSEFTVVPWDISACGLVIAVLKPLDLWFVMFWFGITIYWYAEKERRFEERNIFELLVPRGMLHSALQM